MGLSGFAVSPHTGARLETTTLLCVKAYFRPVLSHSAASLPLNKRAKRRNISAAYLIKQLHSRP